VCRFQLGEFEVARVLIERAINLMPNRAAYWVNLGVVFEASGVLSKARSAFESALSLDPSDCLAHLNRGNLSFTEGEFELALKDYDAALTLNPGLINAHVSRANALWKLGRLVEACNACEAAMLIDPRHRTAGIRLASFLIRTDEFDRAFEIANQSFPPQKGESELWSSLLDALIHAGFHTQAIDYATRCLQIFPRNPAWLGCRADARRLIGELDAACEDYQRLLVVQPRHLSAHVSLVPVLVQIDRLAQATHMALRTVRCWPNCAEAISNLGVVLLKRRKPRFALRCFLRAFSINNQLVEAAINLGVAHQELGQLHDALAWFNEALSIDASNVDALWNKSLALLLLGRYREGWGLFEVRLRKADMMQLHDFSAKRWDGKSCLAQKRVCVYAEQGFGDSIQFVRYCELLYQKVQSLIVIVPRTLVRLMQICFPFVTFLEALKDLADVDILIPMLSLPAHLDPDLTLLPIKQDYLFSSFIAERVGSRLKAGVRPSVGIVWQGSTKHVNDHQRSVPLKLLLRFLPTSMSYYSLQMSPRDHETLSLRDLGIPTVVRPDFDFLDTAAVIQSLDLVVCVDTSVAHLAAAMGKQTWILIPFAPDWRWGLSGEHSSWYPSVRLFRQGKQRLWTSALSSLQHELIMFRDTFLLSTIPCTLIK
jgi:tetratricopeptide (TPR) repeat protein